MLSNSLPTTPISEATPRKSAFVISPIGAPGSEVHQRAAYALEYIFREALSDDEWDVHRADEGKNSDSIGQHVITQLHQADLVIADLSGHNPNVFYELAIAHGWRKPVVHLITKGEVIPFDVVDQRTISYDLTDLASVADSVKLLREYAEHALEHSAEVVTPLTTFEVFNQVQADPTGGGKVLVEAFDQVMARLTRIEGQLSDRARKANSYLPRYSGATVGDGANGSSAYYSAASKNLAALSGVDAKHPSPDMKATLLALSSVLNSVRSELENE